MRRSVAVSRAGCVESAAAALSSWFEVQRLNLEWDLEGHHSEPELRVLIDEVDLIELVRRVELPYAECEGHPDIAGGYAGLAAWRLRGRLRDHFLGEERSHLYCGPREKTVLLGCTCGEPGCWPLMARVEVSPWEVRWDEFEQPHRRGRWSHATLGPFVFGRGLYEATLMDAEASSPPDPPRTAAEGPYR
jgi:hypothetical protein